MSGHWDASIRQVQAVEGGVVFAPIDVIGVWEAFDVVAAACVGESLMGVVNCCDPFVAVRNLSRSVAVANPMSITSWSRRAASCTRRCAQRSAPAGRLRTATCWRSSRRSR